MWRVFRYLTIFACICGAVRPGSTPVRISLAICAAASILTFLGEEERADEDARKFHKQNQKLDKVARRKFGKSWEDCNHQESEEVWEERAK
jgi:hypothetical protein